MLWIPQKGTVRVQHNTGSVGAANLGTSVTTGGAASTKGTPAEIFSSTSFDSYWMSIVATEYGATTVAAEGAMDILIGAATEEVLIPNLLMGHCGAFVTGGGMGGKRWDFPLYTPAGSRIAVQAAGARTSTALFVAIYLYGGWGMPPFRVGTNVTTYGMGTVPNGTAITPGTSGGEGSWTEITSATSKDHFAVVPSFQPATDGNFGARAYALDIGVGAATEEMISEGWWYTTDSVEKMSNLNVTMPCFQDIPSGTRLVARVSNNSTNDAAAYQCVLHCVS